MLFTKENENKIKSIIESDRELYFNSIEAIIDENCQTIKNKYINKNPISFFINFFKKRTVTESKIMKIYENDEPFLIELLRIFVILSPMLSVLSFSALLVSILNFNVESMGKLISLIFLFLGTSSFSFFSSYIVLRFGKIKNLISKFKKDNKKDVIDDIKRGFKYDFSYHPISKKLMKYLSDNVPSEVLSAFWVNNRQDLTYYDILSLIEKQQDYENFKSIIETLKNETVNKEENILIKKDAIILK